MWATIAENASESSNRGTLEGWDPEDVAAQFDIEPEQVQAIYDAMQGKVLDGNRLTGWDKRNPKREREDHGSTERVQRHREKKRHETDGNATKRPDREIEREKERLEREKEENPPKSPPASPEIPPGGVPPAEKRGGQPDAAADLFSDQHKKLLGTAYVYGTKDFVHLSDLRKANGLGARASPQGWDVAVMNYFGSPLGCWTLADLAKRFPAFLNSPLDRYGKPVKHIGNANGTHQQNQGASGKSGLPTYTPKQ